jgi:hypothetical protein
MQPLPPWLRWSLYLSSSALWLTGAAVFLLRHFYPVITEFGPASHPWQPKLLVIHGIIAVLVLYLFGWISARHVGEGWRHGRNRWSGLPLITLMAILALTGFAAYYLTNESTRSANGSIHELLGLALIVPALFHWIIGRRIRRADAKQNAQGATPSSQASRLSR